MIKGYNRGARGAPTRGRGRGRGGWIARGGRGTGERGAVRGAAWRAKKDATKRTRDSSESDQDQPPPTRVRGGARVGYRWSSTITGANRIALGVRPPTQQTQITPEESPMEEETEDRGTERGETEVGVRMGRGETDSEVEEAHGLSAQQS